MRIANGSGNSVTELSHSGAVLPSSSYSGPDSGRPPSRSTPRAIRGNVWVANRGANTVTELNRSGAPATSSGYSGTGIVKPLGIAISQH